MALTSTLRSQTLSVSKGTNTEISHWLCHIRLSNFRNYQELDFDINKTPDQGATGKPRINDRYLVSRKVRDKYFDADISVNRIQNGVINETAKKLGIFYNNLSQDEESSLNKKESLYISFGLFEDKFLNNFVSYWQNEDGTERNPNQNVNLPKFSSVNSYVRFDNNLLNMMKAPLQSDDEVTSFLYPDTWYNTYIKLKPVDSSEKNITLNDKDKRRIPLRELFISVPIISEAFKRSANVNDALEFIFNRIYQDSANIINIKLVKNNEAETSLTFHDVNVLPVVEDNDEILTFD